MRKFTALVSSILLSLSLVPANAATMVYGEPELVADMITDRTTGTQDLSFGHVEVQGDIYFIGPADDSVTTLWKLPQNSSVPVRVMVAGETVDNLTNLAAIGNVLAFGKYSAGVYILTTLDLTTSTLRQFDEILVEKYNADLKKSKIIENGEVFVVQAYTTGSGSSVLVFFNPRSGDYLMALTGIAAIDDWAVTQQHLYLLDRDHVAADKLYQLQLSNLNMNLIAELDMVDITYIAAIESLLITDNSGRLFSLDGPTTPGFTQVVNPAGQQICGSIRDLAGAKILVRLCGTYVAWSYELSRAGDIVTATVRDKLAQDLDNNLMYDHFYIGDALGIGYAIPDGGTRRSIRFGPTDGNGDAIVVTVAPDAESNSSFVNLWQIIGGSARTLVLTAPSATSSEKLLFLDIFNSELNTSFEFAPLRNAGSFDAYASGRWFETINPNFEIESGRIDESGNYVPESLVPLAAIDATNLLLDVDSQELVIANDATLTTVLTVFNQDLGSQAAGDERFFVTLLPNAGGAAEISVWSIDLLGNAVTINGDWTTDVNGAITDWTEYAVRPVVGSNFAVLQKWDLGTRALADSFYLIAPDNTLYSGQESLNGQDLVFEGFFSLGGELFVAAVDQVQNTTTILKLVLNQDNSIGYTQVSTLSFSAPTALVPLAVVEDKLITALSSLENPFAPDGGLASFTLEDGLNVLPGGEKIAFAESNFNFPRFQDGILAVAYKYDLEIPVQFQDPAASVFLITPDKVEEIYQPEPQTNGASGVIVGQNEIFVLADSARYGLELFKFSYSEVVNRPAPQPAPMATNYLDFRELRQGDRIEVKLANALPLAARLGEQELISEAMGSSIWLEIPIKATLGELPLILFTTGGTLTLTVNVSHYLWELDGTVDTSVRRTGDQVRVMLYDLVGSGKARVLFNGDEVAWVNAKDEFDSKLRYVPHGHYLVRTLLLEPGKNVIEIYQDDQRVRRVSYYLPKPGL